MISAHVTSIREKQDWNASFPLGLTSNASAALNTFRADVHYFYKRQWGGGLQYFSTWGDTDQMKFNMGDPVMGSAAGSPEGFLQQVSPVESVVGREQFPERLPAVQSQVLPAHSSVYFCPLM